MGKVMFRKSFIAGWKGFALYWHGLAGNAFQTTTCGFKWRQMSQKSDQPQEDTRMDEYSREREHVKESKV